MSDIICIGIFGDLLKGTVKECAFVLAMTTLKSPYPIFSMSLSSFITVRNRTGKKITLEWEPPAGIAAPPEYWLELKKEFERICELKAFV